MQWSVLVSLARPDTEFCQKQFIFIFLQTFHADTKSDSNKPIRAVSVHTSLGGFDLIVSRSPWCQKCQTELVFFGSLGWGSLKNKNKSTATKSSCSEMLTLRFLQRLFKWKHSSFVWCKLPLSFRPWPAVQISEMTERWWARSCAQELCSWCQWCKKTGQADRERREKQWLRIELPGLACRVWTEVFWSKMGLDPGLLVKLKDGFGPRSSGQRWVWTQSSGQRWVWTQSSGQRWVWTQVFWSKMGLEGLIGAESDWA